MPLFPLGSEVIADGEFEQLVEGVCSRPSMYLSPPSLGSVCAFLEGYDTGLKGAPLIGFREWMVVKLNGWNNVGWPGLAQRLISGEQGISRSEDAKLLLALGKLLKQYLDYRRTHGLTVVFTDYAEWLKQQEWYEEGLRPKRSSASKRRK
jgi:hypothetical protein